MITILVEGRTEGAFAPKLREFLSPRLAGRMPRLSFAKCNGRLPKHAELRRTVGALLTGRHAADHVIALTDVYTGTREFADAAEAKAKMREWVGPEKRFHPHAAQHDFEAWLLPFWATIQKLAGHSKGPPPGKPETVNHDKPPSYHIRELFAAGKSRTHYNKVRDGARILRDNDLAVSADACPELKAFLNTILALCGGESL